MKSVFLIGLFGLLLTAPTAHAEVSTAPAAADFSVHAKRLFEVAACGGGEDVVRGAIAAKHCKKLQKTIQKYRDGWLSKARPFFAELVPKEVPKTIVYPFGGADLMTVLAVYPDFKELTSISLEAGGDPRGLEQLAGKSLRNSLDIHQQYIKKLVDVNHSRTLDLGRLKGDPLPSQVVFGLVGLVTHGYEPVSLRYFEILPDGSLRYYSAADVAKADAMGKKYRGSKLNRKRADFFGNFELVFRKVGDEAERTYRHIRANLDDEHLATKTKPVLMHLERKGKITAITKAASYLLWWRGFQTMRDYLMKNMQWMVSDSTGIPNNLLDTTTFEQLTYGRFSATAIKGSADGEVAMRKLWAGQERRKLPFMFGYPSKAQHKHLMVTRRK